MLYEFVRVGPFSWEGSVGHCLKRRRGSFPQAVGERKGRVFENLRIFANAAFGLDKAIIAIKLSCAF